MITFSHWLLFREARQTLVPPSVLQAYEGEFKQALHALIQRTQDPALRQKFTAMLDCPIQDRRGQCRSFSEYILSALIKNGIHERYDIEAALSYVFEKLMMATSEAGAPRETLFGSFDPNRPYTLEGNPLVARFFTWLKFTVNNIRKGKIPRLSRVEQRPQGTVSIGIGRSSKDEPSADVSPDRIVGRPDDEAELTELIQDIVLLLQRKQPAYPINLVGLFQSILAGQNSDQQRKQFGDRAARIGRQVIVQTIQEYAEATGNYLLLRLLDQFKDFRANKPSPARRTVAKVSKPQRSEKERDFSSILAVIDKLGRPVGTADLGKYRRRWLEYAPRDPNSGFKNRLEETLVSMVREGVLRALQTQKGAFVYEPGPAAGQYRQVAAA